MKNDDYITYKDQPEYPHWVRLKKASAFLAISLKTLHTAVDGSISSARSDPSEAEDIAETEFGVNMLVDAALIQEQSAYDILALVLSLNGHSCDGEK